MAIYTDSELYDRIDSLIYTNNTKDIDASELNQLLKDLVDSKLALGSSTGSGGGVPVFSGTIAAAQIVNNEKPITHGLNTLIPVLFIKAANGDMWGEVHYTYKATDANNILITFEDTIAAGTSVEFIVVKFKAEAGDVVPPPEPIGDLIFSDTFDEAWVDNGYLSHPAGYTLLSVDIDFDSVTPGEFWRVAKDENNKPRFIANENYLCSLALVTNIQLFFGNNYTLKIKYKSNTEVKIFGGGYWISGFNNNLMIQGGLKLPNTNGQWAEITGPVQIFANLPYTHYFAFGAFKLYEEAVNLDITIDNISLYIE